MNAASHDLWYAVQAKPGAERIAQESLESLGLETLLPKVRRERYVQGSLRSAVRPLFPNYLFARFDAPRCSHLVRYSRGVCRVVGCGDRPVPIEETIMAELRARLDTAGIAELTERAWQPGDRLQVEGGPFRGWSGVFERALSDHDRVVILLEAIVPTRTILSRRWLSRLPAS